MSTPNRITVRRDGSLVSGGRVLARPNVGQALELAEALITAAVRREALGEAESEAIELNDAGNGST